MRISMLFNDSQVACSCHLFAIAPQPRCDRDIVRLGRNLGAADPVAAHLSESQRAVRGTVLCRGRGGGITRRKSALRIRIEKHANRMASDGAKHLRSSRAIVSPEEGR